MLNYLPEGTTAKFMIMTITVKNPGLLSGFHLIAAALNNLAMPH